MSGDPIIVLINGMTSKNVQEDWRSYGKQRRRKLLKQDEANGGTRFLLSDQCRIQQYFDVADRVSGKNNDRGWRLVRVCVCAHGGHSPFFVLVV